MPAAHSCSRQGLTRSAAWRSTTRSATNSSWTTTTPSTARSGSSRSLAGEHTARVLLLGHHAGGSGVGGSSAGAVAMVGRFGLRSLGFPWAAVFGCRDRSVSGPAHRPTTCPNSRRPPQFGCRRAGRLRGWLPCLWLLGIVAPPAFHDPGPEVEAGDRNDERAHGRDDLLGDVRARGRLRGQPADGVGPVWVQPRCRQTRRTKNCWRCCAPALL